MRTSLLAAEVGAAVSDCRTAYLRLIGPKLEEASAAGSAVALNVCMIAWYIWFLFRGR
jgi:hypothetical protein